jgi:hypothetical protein
VTRCLGPVVRCTARGNLTAFAPGISIEGESAGLGNVIAWRLGWVLYQDRARLEAGGISSSIEEVESVEFRKLWTLWTAVAGIFAMVAFVAVVVAGAAFAGTTMSSKEKSATLTGTAVWSLQTYTIGGAFEGELGRGTYTGTLTGGPDFTTPTCGPVCEDVTGTITFSAKNGDFTAEVQTGSVVALEEIASHSFRDFTLDLEVVSGTRRYAHASGALTLAYTSIWEHEFVDGVFINEIGDSGTLTGTPKDKKQ